MSVLYPEEEAILPKKGDDNVLGKLITAAKDAGGTLTDEAIQAIPQLQKLKDLGENALEGAEKWVQKTFGQQDVAAWGAAELTYNRDAVDNLKKQYAKHNAAFNDMSDEDFLAGIISKDKDKIHSLVDLDKAVSDRMDYSQKHEINILNDRKAARDGIDYNAKVEGFLPNSWTKGGYSDKELEGLGDSKHKDLMDKFKEDYKAQIDQYGLGATLAAVRETYEQNQHNAQENAKHASEKGVSHTQPLPVHERGDDFKKAVWTQLWNDKHGAEEQKKQAEKQAIANSGIDLAGNESQRGELGHITAVMGHSDLYLTSEQMQKSPGLAKAALAQFMKDFGGPDGKSGDIKEFGAAAVLAAGTEVHNAKNGENQGANKMSPDEYREAIHGQLVLDRSKIDLNDDAQRLALATAVGRAHPESLPKVADGATDDQRIQAAADSLKITAFPEPASDPKHASIANQAIVVANFEKDYAAEIKAAGGDEKKVLAAVAATTGTFKSPEEYHAALAATLNGNPPAPPAEADPAKTGPTAGPTSGIDKIKRAELELAEDGKYTKNADYMHGIGQIDGVAASRVKQDLEAFAKDWNTAHKDQQVNTGGVLDDKMLAALDAHHKELNQGKDADLKAVEDKVLHGTAVKPPIKNGPAPDGQPHNQLELLQVLSQQVHQESADMDKMKAYISAHTKDKNNPELLADEQKLKATDLIQQYEKQLTQLVVKHPDISASQIADVMKDLNTFRQKEQTMTIEQLDKQQVPKVNLPETRQQGH